MRGNKAVLFAVLGAFCSTSASATQIYSVCVGDGPNNACQVGNDDYNFDCAFGKANSTNTDAAAAQYVCQMNNSTVSVVTRNGVYGGGACGVIKLLVTCK